MYLTSKDFKNLYNLLKDRSVKNYDTSKGVQIVNYKCNSEIVYTISNMQNGRVFLELLSLVIQENNFDLDSYFSYFITMIDNGYSMGYNSLSLTNNTLSSEGIICLNTRYKDKFIFLIRKEEVVKYVILKEDFPLNQIFDCFEFAYNVVCRKNNKFNNPARYFELPLSYADMRKTYTDTQILYILCLLQYSAKNWSKKILFERNLVV